ncbi:hypothetical protein ACIRPH_31070 [Nocardiopsis sp. NPDC101807]|uniref:hypothetical protein n=1 Tax=Nocardiopsis sp. NPDC101807 TaxID=3364339 RepID=UPI00381A23C7
MELDLLDRGHDLLDFYRGRISFRRMYLLVVRDVARMPRLRTALAGLDPWQPIFGELEYAVATCADLLQVVQRTVHTAHGMKPKLKTMQPYPRPGEKPRKPPGPPKLSQQQRAYLEQFAPPAE